MAPRTFLQELPPEPPAIDDSWNTGYEPSAAAVHEPQRTEADTAQKIEPQEPLEELDESPRRANGHLPGPENVEVFEAQKHSEEPKLAEAFEADGAEERKEETPSVKPMAPAEGSALAKFLQRIGTAPAQADAVQRREAQVEQTEPTKQADTPSPALQPSQPFKPSPSQEAPEASDEASQTAPQTVSPPLEPKMSPPQVAGFSKFFQRVTGISPPQEAKLVESEVVQDFRNCDCDNSIVSQGLECP
eukprot:g27733.t1